MLPSIKQRLYPVVSRFVSRTMLIEGPLRGTDVSVRCLLVGSSRFIEELKSFFEQGLLLFVTKDGTDVAGALSLLQDGMVIFRRSGVLDGDESHVKAGAQTALYYFQLRYAVEHGLRAFDTMKSSPFLNDGIYRHKAEWGATVWADDEAERWVYVFAAGPSEKAAHFFAVNPVVVQAADGLRAVIGEPGATDVPRPSFDTLADRYHARGLKVFIVVRPAASFDVP